MYININSFQIIFLSIIPVQLPLHEPYFDLTPIEIIHSKAIYYKNIN